MKKYHHNNTQIIVFESGKFAISKEGIAIKETVTLPSNFYVGVSCTNKLSIADNQFIFCGVEEFDWGITLKYKDEKFKLQMTTELKFIPNTNVITQQNIIKNMGENTVKLTQLPSAVIGNIISDDKPWYENDEISINICYNKWQAEAQWQKFTPEQLGLTSATAHFWESETYDIKSTGSWSTGTYYPMVIIEDVKNNTVYFAEIEGSHNWNIKLCSCGGYSSPMLYTELTACNEENGGWYYDLKPNEEYKTERAFYGSVSGGFEEAAAELNEFKRFDSCIKPDNSTPYVIYNTYMNSVWCKQLPERIIPLIKAASDAGCEIFCIDDGWSQTKDGRTTNHLGDWYQRTDIYDSNGLKDIADIIKQHGMIPGIWFEFEACMENAYGYSMDEDAILKRYDEIIGAHRTFYNMKNEKVRKYLKERIREIYNCGFRYIKNDYNKTTGIGCTNNYNGLSSAEGLIENADAFCEFINELYADFPGLIIENCGSGALRDDNKALRHFKLQSTSDQEIYTNNPSIVMGSMAIMPPEKAGVWSYPYPVTFYEQEKFELSDEYIQHMKDGIQTVFNMINAIFGTMYLSGRIDLCDEGNFSLIKEAVSLFKKIRAHIIKSKPIYPTGFHRLNKKECFSFGTISDDKLMLALWNIDSDEKNLCIDLGKWIDEECKIKTVYPQKNDIEYSLKDCKMNINFKEKNTAVLFEIDRRI